MLVQAQDEADSTRKKKVEFVAIPIPSYNEVQGFGMAVTGGGFYSMNNQNEDLKSSSTMLYGLYMQNKTWLFAALQEFHFDDNNYWIDMLGVKSNFKYQYYQPLPILGEDKGINISYASDISIFKANVLRRLASDVFVGVHMKFSKFNTIIDPPELPTIPDFNIEDPGSKNSFYSGLGFKFAYDTRDNPLNPSKGISTDIISIFNSPLIGSDLKFQIVEMSFNYYFKFGQKSILASRFYSKLGFNDIPFEEQAILGFAGPTGKDVRGYSSGRYRANQLYDGQVEWRWNFYKRWGTILFGGLALVGDDFEEMAENGLLPAVGTGFRFNAAPDRDVNVGIDVALGKNDYGIYFAISEAF